MYNKTLDYSTCIKRSKTQNIRDIVKMKLTVKGNAMRVLTTLTIVIMKLLNYFFPSFSICSYQNSFKHSICIEMLRQGYHKSFSELFALIQKWNALRDAGGPGSAIWQQKPLEEQHEKLDQLQHFLTRAEAAQRAGKRGNSGKQSSRS